MKVEVRQPQLKSHREILITGQPEQIHKVVSIINQDRLAYHLDHCSNEDNDNGTITAEYIAHKSHHHKALNWIKSLVQSH